MQNAECSYEAMQCEGLSGSMKYPVCSVQYAVDRTGQGRFMDTECISQALPSARAQGLPEVVLMVFRYPKNLHRVGPVDNILSTV